MNSLAEYLQSIGASRVVLLSNKQFLFKQGDAARQIFVLIRGRIKMLRDTIDGNQVVIHHARAGESLAEAALFAEHYHCHARAETDCEVQVYSKQAILPKLRQDPDATMQWMAVLAKQVQSLRLLMELRNVRSAKDRILQYLMLQSDERGKVRLDATLKDVADRLGITHETLYRKLQELETECLLTRAPDGIRLNSHTG